MATTWQGGDSAPVLSLMLLPSPALAGKGLPQAAGCLSVPAQGAAGQEAPGLERMQEAPGSGPVSATGALRGSCRGHQHLSLRIKVGMQLSEMNIVF